MRFCYFDQAGLKLLGSSHPPISASQGTGTTDMYYQWLNSLTLVKLFNDFYYIEKVLISQLALFL
jgi:hypothetical protein